MTVTSGLADTNSATGTVASASWRDYLALTKPRIIELLLVTTIPVMFAAAGGWVSWQLLLATVGGGALAAGGANALNCALDHDIDRQMKRTAHRATATGAISARSAVLFGSALSLVSVVVLAGFVNILSAALAGAAIVSYVGGYTLLLKRRTPSNIVWGGIAGCFPVLIGWAAVTDSLSWAAVCLFLVVFFWTPPHYWPLSIRYREDYAKADVPMLGAVASSQTVSARIIRYTWATVAISLAYIWLADTGVVYAVVSVAAGSWLLLESYRLQRRSGEADSAMRLFHASISYLTLLFVAVGVDPFIHL